MGRRDRTCGRLLPGTGTPRTPPLDCIPRLLQRLDQVSHREARQWVAVQWREETSKTREPSICARHTPREGAILRPASLLGSNTAHAWLSLAADPAVSPEGSPAAA